MRGLDRLLRPRSVAVIGGGQWCANVIAQCEQIGFSGDIWPVHPTRTTIAGRSVFADIGALPQAPDAVFVGVNRDATIDVVTQLAARGAGGAVCFASGYREAQGETGDGADKQARLLAAAGDMPILGPNCYGLLNYLDGVALWPDQHGGVRVDRGVALITQSSNIAINLTMQRRGVPVAYVVTVGNQAQTGLAEVARAVLQDDRVTALGLYVEGIDDLAGFEAMAQAAHAVGKPIVAIKVGTSDQAQAATVSHTASLTGSAAGARALFRRLGIGWATSPAVLLETLKLLHVAGPLPSRDLVSMSCSGGEASLMADIGQAAGLSFPALVPGQELALRAALGPKVALANPLDYHTYIWGDVAAMTATFTAMMQGPAGIGCVILDFPRADRCDASAWHPVLHAIAQTRSATGRVMAVVASLPDTLPEQVAQQLMADGIVPLCGLTDAAQAIAIGAEIGAAAVDVAPVAIPPKPKDGRVLSEAEAKSLLRDHGLGVPKAIRADNARAAREAADDIGYPVVLKGEGVAHKTEAGAVVLNLTGPDTVEQAARAMPADSFLVEQMITPTVAELLVGVVADPAHGYVLTLAAGGTLTEILGDSATLLLPVTRADVRASLNDLAIAAVLNGYRGQAPACIDSIEEAVMAVQACVLATGAQEIEINPLLCTPDRAIAADALIRM